MTNDRLEILLREADRGAMVSPIENSLAQRVRGGVLRRRVMRRGVAAMAVLLAVVPAMWTMRRGSTPSSQPARLAVVVPQVAPLSDEESARLAELTAADLLRLRREREDLKIVAAPDVSDRARLSLDETAAALLANGDLLVHEKAAEAQAAEAYKLVQTEFPGSPAAGVAAERLRQMGS